MSNRMRGAIIGAVIGLILATLGFWKLLLVLAFALVGVIVGHFFDLSAAKAWLSGLLNR